MEGDNFVSLVVPPNGVTVSLFAGALVPSTAPSSHSIPRLPICPEVQTVNQVYLHGTRRENHSASAPITTRPLGRSRVREPPTSRRQRSRSKHKSRSRSRRHRASCSPDAGKSRHDSKNPKRDRRSCSVTSTCSRNLRRESPNERSPARPLSGDRQRRRRESKQSPNRHYTRKYISMATSIDVPIENDSTVAQGENNSASSETDIPNGIKENPNDVAANKFDAIKWVVKFVENEQYTVSKKSPVVLPKVNLTLDNAKYQNFDENTEIKQVSEGIAVNYVTGLQTYVNKLKSFYSEPLDCSGYDVCPPLRDRMAHHRLRHHSGYKIDPRVNTTDYPAKDNILRKPTSPTRDHLVQTKVTLGDLGEIVIRLDKGVKVSNENDDGDPDYARRNTLTANKGVKVSNENDDEEPNYARRNTLVANKYTPTSKNGRPVDIDYNRHRISNLERPNNNVYGTDNTNENRGMTNAQRRSSKRRSTISKQIMPSERNEDKSNYNYKNQEEGTPYNHNTGYYKTGDKTNQDRLDTNTYRDKLTVPNDQNEYDSDIGNYGNDNKRLDPNKRHNRKPQDTKDDYGFNDMQSSSPANDRNGMKNNNTNDNYYRNRRQSKQNQSKDSPTRSKYRDDKSGNNDINDLNDDENDINSSTFEQDDITPLVNNTIYLGKDPLTALSEEVQQWLHFVPLFPDTIDKDTIINDLMEKLNKLSYIPMDSEERDKVLERVISDCLDKLHTWYPGAKRDQADYKHNLIQSLLQRITPVLNQTAHGSRNVKQDTKPVFNQTTQGSRNKHQQEEMQQDRNGPYEIQQQGSRNKHQQEEMQQDRNGPYEIQQQGSRNKHQQEEMQQDRNGPYEIQQYTNGQYEMQRNTDGQNNYLENDTEPDEANLTEYKISKRNDPSGHRHKSKKKYKTAYKSGHLVRSTISSNVICGDTRVKKTSAKKPTEKYKSEFAQAIYNWITRYDFLKHDGLQQISIHDLIGILLSRLSPYLDRPYNSTNKLILKAKIVDIMNSLPICIHHSPYQKTQVIKFAEELAKSLLNIQTRFEDDKKYAKNLLEPQYHLLHIEEVRKRDLLRTQISNELRQCLQDTLLSDDVLVQIRLTEIVLNYFETFQKGYTDVIKNAIMCALEEANLFDNDKTIILDKIVKSLHALSEDRTVLYKMPSIYPESGLSVNKSEMEIRDTVFSLFTQTQAQVQTQRARNKKGSGLSIEEDEHLENLKRVIRDWTVTLPEPFSKLKRKQKEDFISGLAEDIFIQEKIQNIAPIPNIQRDKFWKFFAYRWFYRISLFEDLNSAEPYSVDLCNRLYDVSLEKTMSPSDNYTGPRSDGTNTGYLNNNESRRNKWEEEKRRREEDRINMQRQREEDRLRNREDINRKQNDRNNIFLRSGEVAQEADAFGKDENSQINNGNKRCELCNKQKVMLWEDNPASEPTGAPENYFYRTNYSAKITAAQSEVMNVNENAREPQLTPPAPVNRLRPTTFIAPVLSPTQTISQPLITKAEVALSPKSTLISNPSLLVIGSSTSQPEAQTVRTICRQNKLHCQSFTTSEPPNSIEPAECLTETVNSYQCNQNPNENKMNQASVILKVNTHNTHEHRQSIIENHKGSPPTSLSANNDKDDWVQKCPCIQNKQIPGTEKTSGLSNGDRYIKATTPLDLQNMRQIQAPEDLVSKNERSTNKPSVNACSISNTQEFVNQMYQVVDMCLYDQDRYSPSHTSLGQHSNAYPKIKSTQLKHEISIMKEFILKYLEYKDDMNDPIVRVTFFYLLKNELQQTGCKRINKPSNPENLEEELKYMKLISEWLKQIPVDEAFNMSMNKDRIYFVKDLAQNLARIDINKIRAPYAMDYDKYLERVIQRYAIQLPLLPEHQENIKAVIEQLLHVIKSQPQRKAYPGDQSLHGICISEQNKIELLDKHIRQNGEQLLNDELVLDAWAHRLVEEVLQSVSERSSNITQTWQVFNFSVGPYTPEYGYPTYRFRLELDYAKEIVEFLNSLPVPSSPIDVEKIHELTEKLILRNRKMVENLNDGRDDQELMNLLEKWMMDLPLNLDKKSKLVNAIQNLAERINKVTKKYDDTIKTETSSNNSYDTRILTDSSMMHCRKNMERQSSECQMAHLIENWSQCLPIDGPKKENIKVMKAHVAKIVLRKICELKANTNIYNDDSMYKHYLEDAINTQFDGVPVDGQLKFYKEYLVTILINKVMALKTRIPEKRTGHAYRIALEKALEEVVSTISEDRDVGFEIYVHQLTNKFLLEHFDHSKHPAKLKYCRKIQHRINKHVQSAIHRTGRLFTPDETNNLFYNVLFKVPVPNNNSLKHQIEYIKTRCEIDNWFDTLPLKKTDDPSEFDKWDHTLMSLAKNVVNFEQEPTCNIKLHKEILRHLARFPLEREYEFQRSDIAYRLLTLLATTFEARQCVALEDLAVKDSASQTNVPEQSLSNSVTLSADRGPNEIIINIIVNWCRSFPLKAMTDIENQTIKENLAKQLTNKINHLNDSGVDNDRLYEKYLNEEIEKAVATLHSKTELHKSISERKQALKMDIMYQRPLLKIDALRKEYKLELSKVIEDVLSKPKNLTADKKIILEVIKDEIMDNFIEYNYNTENDEIKNNHKKKLVKSVFDYLDIVKNKEETIPLETQVVKANQLITEMLKIAEPNNLAMKEEIQEVRMKYKLDELFKLPKAFGIKFASRKKATATLAKKLHEIEKTGYNNENITKMKEEISKTMNAIGFNLKQENINEFIKNLELHKITRNVPLLGSFYLHKRNNNIMYCTQEPSKTSTCCGPEMSSSSWGCPGWNPGSESQSNAQSHNTAKDTSHDDQSEIHRMNSQNFYGRSRSFPRHSGQPRDNNCKRTPSLNESETSSIQLRNPTCREKINHPPLQDIATSVGEKDFTQTVTGQSKSGQGHETLAPMVYHQENVAHVQAFWSQEAPDKANNAPSTRNAQVCTQTLNCAQQTSLVANSEKCCGHPQHKDQVTLYKSQQDVNAPNSENTCLLSVLHQTDQITNQTKPAVLDPWACRQFPSPQMGAEGQQLPSLVPTQKAQNAPLVSGAQQLPFGAYFDRYGVMAYGVPEPGALQNIVNRYDQFPVAQTQGVASQRMPIAGPNVAQDSRVQQLPGAFTGQSLYRNFQQQQQRLTSGCAQIAPGHEQSVLQNPETWYRRNFPAPNAVIQASSGQTQAQSLALPLESNRCGQAPLQWTQQAPQAHIPNPVFYQAPGVLQTGAITAELHKVVPGNAYTQGQFSHVPKGYKHSAPIVAHIEPPPVPAPLPTQTPHPLQYCSPKQPQQPVTQCYYQPTDHQSSKSLHFNPHPPTVERVSDDKSCTQSQPLQRRSDQSNSPYKQPKPEKSLSRNQPSPPPDLNHQRHPQSQHGYENLQAQMKPVAQSQQCSILKVVAYPSPKASHASSIHTGCIQYDNYPQQSPERSSAIPSSQESEHMKNDPRENIGSPQRSVMNTPEKAGSVSHTQYITNSPSTQQQATAAAQQNLYQMTQAKSFYVQVNQSEHTQRIPEAVQTYNVKPEIVNAGCSNIEAYNFQRVATSTTTISGNRNPEAKVDDGTDCGNKIRDQSTQGVDQNVCNQGVYPYGVQSPMPYWQPCNPADRCGVKAIPVPLYNPYHLDSKAACDKYFSKQHSKCCAIPVLQYCDSVQDFLPTLLPMNWFKVRSRKKRQPNFYSDRI